MASNIIFKPHVGSAYGHDFSLFKKKTLILGGSHYIEDEYDLLKQSDRNELSGFTQEIIGHYLDPECKDAWKKTYSIFINSVYGRDTDLADRQAFFDSVVFYNYLQEAAGQDAYAAHEYDYHEQRHFDAFLEVINEVKPEVVIAWGKKVWDALPNDWGYGQAEKKTDLAVNGTPFTSCYDYPYFDPPIRLIGVHHPSAGYASDYHHEVFEVFDIVGAWGDR